MSNESATGSTVIADVAIARDRRGARAEAGCAIGCLSVLGLAAVVAVWNLLHPAGLPTASLVASAVWVLVVALALREIRRESGTLRAGVRDYWREISGDVLLRLERDADGQVWFRHGLVRKGDAKLDAARINPACVRRVTTMPGQFPPSVYPVIHYDIDPSRPPKSLPWRTEAQARALIGVPLSLESAGALAARIVRLLEQAGIDLAPDGEHNWRATADGGAGDDPEAS